MRTTQIFRHITIICLVTSFGCSKDNLDENSKHSMMQANVDGELIICDESVSLRKDLAGTLWGVEGYNKDGVGFMFQFPISHGVGTYGFLKWSGTFQNEGWLMYGIGEEQFKSINGAITITKATSHNFEGTFFFQSKSYEGNIRDISEGKFKIEY